MSKVTEATIGNQGELKRLLNRSITEQQTAEIDTLGKESEFNVFGKNAVIFVLLTLTAKFGNANNANSLGKHSSSTPSGAVPTHLKWLQKNAK